MIFYLQNYLIWGSNLTHMNDELQKKLIDEHQCTIGWFVKNNKVSHIDDNVNSMIAENIE